MESSSSDLKFIHEFMLKHQFAVISSITQEGKPQASKVEYFVLNGGVDIAFRTKRDSRKYQNIIQNPAIALEIGDQDTDTVQYEGIATEFSGIFSRKDSITIASRSNKSRVIYDEDDLVYFIVKPTWIRYTDVATRPWRQIEVKLEIQ